MTRRTFTAAAIALVCSTAWATPPPVTVVSPCECRDNHGIGRCAAEMIRHIDPAHANAIRFTKDQRGVDLISDALPFTVGCVLANTAIAEIAARPKPWKKKQKRYDSFSLNNSRNRSFARDNRRLTQPTSNRHHRDYRDDSPPTAEK